MVELGRRYRDTATEFSGTAVGRWERLGGTTTVQLARLDSSGNIQEQWFDPARLEPVEQRPGTGFGS